MKPKIQIAPSILSADFGNLNADIKTVEPYCDRLHVDVMDGHFVPNITLGAPIMRMIKTKLLMEAHLMIQRPQDYIKDFVDAGAKLIIVHQEACTHLHRIIHQIKDYGVKVGVSLNPATSLVTLENVLEDLDQVLIMTVNPGFGGQSFIENAVPKIIELRELMPNLDIEVDGGVTAETAKIAIEAGANILVAGSYIFGSKDRKKAIASLRA
ncbi:MAG: ribulose-phosphate 3-epimerase [Oligoflexales bacterium]|nr:ribulose-phosphate 3-epimerase [Oligoflexales bacterium]